MFMLVVLLMNIRPLTSTNEFTCGDYITGEFGVITSPNYPYNYPNNHVCTSVINVNAGSFIQIYIEFMDIENHRTCGYDYLEIIDGSHSTDHVLAKYCERGRYNGTNTALCSKNGNAVRIKFKSDGSANGIGFRLSWKAFDGNDKCVSCREQANAYETRPSYCTCNISGYGDESFCPGAWSSWMTEPCSKTCGYGVQIKTRKHMFYYDRSENITLRCVASLCPVHGNWSTWEWSSCSKSCGGGIAWKYRRCNSPFPRYGGRYCMRADGWRGSYEQLTDTCNTYPCIDEFTCGDYITGEFGVITSPNYPYNYPNNHVCTSVINVNASFIQIYIEFMDIEYHTNCRFDYLEIIDGSLSSDSVLATYCEKGWYNMTNITLCSKNGNVVRIKFKSDGSENGKGFKLSWKAFDGDDECVSCRAETRAAYTTIPSSCTCKADYGNVSFCPGGWGSWIAEACSNTCGGGVQTKTRRNMFYNDRSEDITVQCNTHNCPAATPMHTAGDGSVLIIVTLPIFNGTIRNYDIIVTELGLSKNFPRLSPDSYNVSDIDNNVDGLYVAGRTYDINMFGKEFVIGKRGRQRRSLPAVQDKSLKNDTYYGIFVRGYIDEFIYESTNWYPPIKIDSQEKEGNISNIIIIIAVAIPGLIIIMTVISIVICCYHKKRRPKPPVQQNEERGNKNLAFNSDITDRAIPSAPPQTLDIRPPLQDAVYANIGEELLTSAVATSNGSHNEREIHPDVDPPRLPPKRRKGNRDVTHELWVLSQHKTENASNETMFHTVENEASNVKYDNSHDITFEGATDRTIENNVHLRVNFDNNVDSSPIEGKQEVDEITDIQHYHDYDVADEGEYPDDTSDDEHPHTDTYENLPPTPAFAYRPPINRNVTRDSSEDHYTGLNLNENDTPVIYEAINF